MDPRYEDDIDLIVGEMGEKEFTARDVLSTLERLHINGSGKTRGALPNTREVSQYLRECTTVTKAGRKGSPPVNHYRREPEEEDTMEEQETEEGGEVEREPLTQEEAIRQQMDRVRNCPHDQPWALIPAREQCPLCGGLREVVEPMSDQEVRALVSRGYSPGAVMRLNNREVTGLWAQYHMSAMMRDNTTTQGHVDALEDLAMMRSIELQMARRREATEKTIRMNWQGQAKR